MDEDTIHTDVVPARPIGEDSVGHDPTTETFHTRFDAAFGTERDAVTEALTATIVETVGAVTNRDPCSMAPLFATVDPESLADLVTSTRDHPLTVSFSYEDCHVSVSSDGTVVVKLSND
ncbi:hypothetical protein Htur_3713 [Haloterrigena turkmenica DSM 5511]|uniref:Halobacterial output domain-containing protein n=1 Tax=Haloterrigena turkmenica (strain ATCC 51198 / DSM 5511 / JCM 9101 / NCIMB 13204 / VKM B-1734 / 4k) TaxID=543526 RepID=D2RRV8_HALTV|nr:HalOD1 output domain-containing protein [Haloterrigena turkmenica]ADB62575.1 hypothetical protein Htur_3713 [Haloterrigena turkmenica DSM 5511]